MTMTPEAYQNAIDQLREDYMHGNSFDDDEAGTLAFEAWFDQVKQREWALRPHVRRYRDVLVGFEPDIIVLTNTARNLAARMAMGGEVMDASRLTMMASRTMSFYATFTNRRSPTEAQIKQAILDSGVALSADEEVGAIDLSRRVREIALRAWSMLRLAVALDLLTPDAMMEAVLDQLLGEVLCIGYQADLGAPESFAPQENDPGWAHYERFVLDRSGDALDTQKGGERIAEYLGFSIESVTLDEIEDEGDDDGQ